MQPSDYRHTLNALHRCKKENAALRRQLIKERKARASVPSAKDGDTPSYRSSRDPQKRIRAHLYTRGRRARHYGRQNYVLFLFDIFTDSAFYLWWSRAWAYARRVRLVRTVALVLAVLWAAARASALFMLISTVYLTLLPVLLVGGAVCLLAALLHARSVNRRLRTALDGRHIRVLFPSRSLPFDEDSQPFFFASARAMAAEPDTAVILVSPYLFSPKGPGGHRMFVTARDEGEHLYLVRNYYYFTLRRRVLDLVDPQLSILY